PNGGTLRLLTGACYRVDGTLNLTGRSHVTIDGNGATLRAYTTGTRQRAFWMLRSSSGITLRNLTLIGPNATGEYVTNLEAQHGVTVNGSTNVLIDRITVKQTYGDGVAIQQAGNGSPAQADGVIVRDSTFQTIGRQGISITHARNVTITGNYFNHV